MRVGMFIAGAVALAACARDTATPAKPVDLFPNGEAIARGAKIESTDFAAEPLRFYRFECQVKSPKPGFVAALWRNPDATWGRDLQGHPGDLRAEDYQPVAASDDWQTVVFYSRAQANATAGCLRVQALEGTMEVKSARVSGPAPAEEVMSWADSTARALPSCRTRPPDRDIVAFSRTAVALREGRLLRIVFLGDSIMQDAANSPIDLWLEENYPGLRVEIITAIGGGAGMQRWNSPEKFPGHDLNLQAAVIDQRPDLVLIGGISNGGDYDAVRAIVSRLQSGTRAIEAPVPDIVLMTGPFGEWAKASDGPTAADDEDARQLRAISTDASVAFFDLRREWMEYMVLATDAGHQPGIFYRDAIHGSTLGRHQQGRMIATWILISSNPYQ